MNNHSTTTPWSVHLRLLGMVMFWGASYSWAKTVVATVPPITAATLRFFLASFALLVWLHRLRRTRQLLTITARQWAGLTLAAISGIVLYTMCFMIALRHIDAGRAAVLFALSPVLTLLLAAWLFREKLNTLIVTGILLAVVGSAIVIAHGNPLTLLRGHIGIGEWLIFASIFLWTGYTLIGRKMLGGMDALSTTVATLLIGAALLLPVSLIVEGTAGWATLLHATPATWGALLALTFGSTVLAYAWYFDGIRALGANVHGPVQGGTGQGEDGGRHRRREQEALTRRGCFRQQFLDVGQETEVQHFVGLVQHQHLDVAQVQRTAVG